MIRGHNCSNVPNRRPHNASTCPTFPFFWLVTMTYYLDWPNTDGESNYISPSTRSAISLVLSMRRWLVKRYEWCLVGRPSFQHQQYHLKQACYPGSWKGFINTLFILCSHITFQWFLHMLPSGTATKLWSQLLRYSSMICLPQRMISIAILEGMFHGRISLPQAMPVWLQDEKHRSPWISMGF